MPIRLFQTMQYFYPRPPRGGRPITKPCSSKLLVFLSTPSARRATSGVRPDSAAPRYFYPRPPRGGRRRLCLLPCLPWSISIHALREEGDRLVPALRNTSVPISIHALREEGDVCPVPAFGLGFYFYPRPPRGGRRRSDSNQTSTTRISIHALREEGDL